MSRIDWATPGERFYEVGVDRGVLYVDGYGVPWIGLVSVNETPTGGEEKAVYIDGVKRSSRATPVEFEATIEAYTYPDEFSECDGTKPVRNGLFATQQVRKPFAMAYRTLVGNDTKGIDAGYKIHLIYNARVAPSSHRHATLSEDVDPDNFSWKITSTTTYMEGFRPTPHFIIDSRDTPRALMTEIEDILYGTDDEPARIPAVHELNYLFTSYNVTTVGGGELPDEPYYDIYDGGQPDTIHATTVDGGVA